MNSHDDKTARNDSKAAAHETAQLKGTMGFSSPVVQRALPADLVDHTTKVAIVGETHDEIPKAKERSDWGLFNVNVFYESDALGAGDERVAPDPPLLRGLFLWNHMNGQLQEFWQDAASGKDISAHPATIAIQKNLVGQLKNELRASRLELIDDAIEAIDAFLANLPADAAALQAMDAGPYGILANAKKDTLSLLFGRMQRLHASSDYDNVASDGFMEERSRQMLKNINRVAPSLTKTIYKVGDEHIGDIVRNKWKPAANVAVLSKAKYMTEYPKLKLDQRGSGNVHLSSQVDNDQL